MQCRASATMGEGNVSIAASRGRRRSNLVRMQTLGTVVATMLFAASCGGGESSGEATVEDQQVETPAADSGTDSSLPAEDDGAATESSESRELLEMSPGGWEVVGNLAP